MGPQYSVATLQNHHISNALVSYDLAVTFTDVDYCGARQFGHKLRRSHGMMSKNRLEAFSDGVIAIIITIMVLDLKTPQGNDLAALRPLLPVFLSYVLSFIYIGIYWNNHHHLLQATQHVSGGILWANLNLLFWLSLTPFATSWLGASSLAPWPVALYGAVLMFGGVAYFILTKALIAHHGERSLLATSIGSDKKGKISVAIFLVAIPFAFLNPWISCICYVTVPVMWLVPDRRIERRLDRSGE